MRRVAGRSTGRTTPPRLDAGVAIGATNRTIGLNESLYTYLVEQTLREPEIMRRLRTETSRLPRGTMQISPEQGQLMGLLMLLVGARRALEIGTFTGYSALAMALALPADGQLICCDVSEEWTRTARRFWREAGVAHLIDLRLAPAAETLAALRAAGEAGHFDFAFIDADKENYDLYYENCLTLVRPGGLIAVDNALWRGSVADLAYGDADTVAIRALNHKVRNDARVDMVLVPIGDGLLLARRRH